MQSLVHFNPRCDARGAAASFSTLRVCQLHTNQERSAWLQPEMVEATQQQLELHFRLKVLHVSDMAQTETVSWCTIYDIWDICSRC